jgi:hypothetical protein
MPGSSEKKGLGLLMNLQCEVEIIQAPISGISAHERCSNLSYSLSVNVGITEDPRTHSLFLDSDHGKSALSMKVGLE